MSTDLENVLVVEKLMDLEKVTNPVNTVLVGPVFKTLNVFPAAAASKTQIVFNNIVAPSLTTVMKRTIRIEMEVQVVVTGTATVATDPSFHAVDGTSGAYIPPVSTGGANICLRANPLAGVCSSVDVRLNGGATNCALASYSQIYPFLQGNNDVKRYASECPLQADNSSVYENTSATSPFNGLNKNSATQSRGSFIAVLTAANTYSIKWTEELIISPFLTGHSMEDIGLVNVNNLTITLRMGDLSAMFSALSTMTGSIAVDIIALPNLLVEFDTQNSIMSQRSPQNAVYPYNQIQTYQQPLGAALPVAGGEASLALTALRLPCQPSKIYLYIGPVTRSTKVPDHFLRITGVSINFNNKNSLLNGMDESSLYTMSAFNAGSDRGGFMSWNQWKYGCGSLVVIDVQRDLSIDEGSQAGSQNQFSTLQITIRYNSANLLYAGLKITGGTPVLPSSYNAYQVIVSPGKAYVSASQCEFVVSGPSPAVVLGLVADENSTKIPEDAVPDSDNPDGKGFGDLIQKGLKLAYEHRGAIMSAAAPHVKKLIGGSMGGQVDGGWVSAGALKHRRS